MAISKRLSLNQRLTTVQGASSWSGVATLRVRSTYCGFKHYQPELSGTKRMIKIEVQQALSARLHGPVTAPPVKSP